VTSDTATRCPDASVFLNDGMKLSCYLATSALCSHLVLAIVSDIKPLKQ
jgi:hypothetical protein